MRKLPKKITVIGVGLIGGSICLGLKKRLGKKVIISGLSHTLAKSQKVKTIGIIDKVINHISNIPVDSDIIVIATPIKRIISTLKELAKLPISKSLIIDVGSTKNIICKEAVKSLPDNFHFIGTHPMAGGEIPGAENSDPNLFINKPWIICSTKLSKNTDIDMLYRLIKLFGAKPVRLTSSKHDQIVTWSSHLPLILANILISTVSGQKKWKDIARVASTGFKDSTRLASHDPKMKKDIIISNETNLLPALDLLKQELEIFKTRVKTSENSIMQYLIKTKNTRDLWLSERL